MPKLGSRAYQLPRESKEREVKISDAVKDQMLKKAPKLGEKLLNLIKKTFKPDAEKLAEIEERIHQHFEGEAEGRVQMLVQIEKLLQLIEPAPIIISPGCARADGATQDSSITESQKIALLAKLYEDIEECSEGFYLRIYYIDSGLNSIFNITEILYQFRNSLVTSTAYERTADVHSHNTYFLKANELKFGAKEPVKNDRFWRHEKINPENIEKELKAKFQSRYHPLSIINEVLTAIKTELQTSYGYQGRSLAGYKTVVFDSFFKMLFPSQIINYKNIWDFFVTDPGDATNCIDINWNRMAIAVVEELQTTEVLSFDPKELTIIKQAFQSPPDEKAINTILSDWTRDIWDFYYIAKHFDMDYQEKFIIAAISEEESASIAAKLETLCGHLGDNLPVNEVNHFLKIINYSTTLKSWIMGFKEKVSKEDTRLEIVAENMERGVHAEGVLQLFSIIDIKEFKSIIDKSPKIYDNNNTVDEFKRSLSFAMEKRPSVLPHILYLIKGAVSLDPEYLCFYRASSNGENAFETVLAKSPEQFPVMIEIAQSILGKKITSILERKNSESENILMLAAKGNSENFKLLLGMTESKEMEDQVFELFTQCNTMNATVLNIAANHNFENYKLLLEHCCKLRFSSERLVRVMRCHLPEDNFLKNLLKNNNMQVLDYTIKFLKKMNNDNLFTVFNNSDIVYNISNQLKLNKEAHDELEEPTPQNEKTRAELQAKQERLTGLLLQLFPLLDRVQKTGYKYFNLLPHLNQKTELCFKNIVLIGNSVLYNAMIKSLEALNTKEDNLATVIHAGLKLSFYSANPFAFKEIFEYFINHFSLAAQCKFLGGDGSHGNFIHYAIDQEQFDAVIVMLDVLKKNSRGLSLLNILLTQSNTFGFNALGMLYNSLDRFSSSSTKSVIKSIIKQTLETTLKFEDEVTQQQIVLGSGFNLYFNLGDENLSENVMDLVWKFKDRALFKNIRKQFIEGNHQNGQLVNPVVYRYILKKLAENDGFDSVDKIEIFRLNDDSMNLLAAQVSHPENFQLILTKILADEPGILSDLILDPSYLQHPLLDLCVEKFDSKIQAKQSVDFLLETINKQALIEKPPGNFDRKKLLKLFKERYEGTNVFISAAGIPYIFKQLISYLKNWLKPGLLKESDVVDLLIQTKDDGKNAIELALESDPELLSFLKEQDFLKPILKLDSMEYKDTPLGKHSVFNQSQLETKETSRAQSSAEYERTLAGMIESDDDQEISSSSSSSSSNKPRKPGQGQKRGNDQHDISDSDPKTSKSVNNRRKNK